MTIRVVNSERIIDARLMKDYCKQESEMNDISLIYWKNTLGEEPVACIDQFRLVLRQHKKNNFSC